MVPGEILNTWLAGGRGLSPVGYPQGAPFSYKDGGGTLVGVAQRFQNATLFWTFESLRDASCGWRGNSACAVERRMRQLGFARTGPAV